MTETQEMHEKFMTNREYSTLNEKFVKDCEQVGIKPTARQASKYRRKFGKVYNQQYKFT